MKMKVKKGKTYLVERTNKVYGGGVFEFTVQNMTKTRIKYHNKWHTIKDTEERFNVLEELK